MLFAMYCLAAAAVAQNLKNVALVNGETINEQDLARASAGEMRQLEAKRPQSDAVFQREKLTIQWKALNDLIAQKLLQAEAAKLMISEKKLLENEVDNYLSDIPERMVEAFYQANGRRIPQAQNLPKPEALSQV